MRTSVWLTKDDFIQYHQAFLKFVTGWAKFRIFWGLDIGIVKSLPPVLWINSKFKIKYRHFPDREQTASPETTKETKYQSMT